jgi:hypothetical protein
MALVRTDVLEEHVDSIIKVNKINELGTRLAAIKSVLTEVTRRHLPEDGISHSHFLEDLKSYIDLIGLYL